MTFMLELISLLNASASLLYMKKSNYICCLPKKKPELTLHREDIPETTNTSVYGGTQSEKCK